MAADRELLVLRHAKSAWDTGAATDFERPLAPRGRRDAPRMGRWLAEQDRVPDHVIASPAARAHETVHLVLEACGGEAAELVWDERVYDAGLDDLLAVLRDCPAEARRVLLVGHNPGLESLVLHLGAAVPHFDGKFFPTAALACLRLPEDWGELLPHSAEVLAVVRPRQLAS